MTSEIGPLTLAVDCGGTGIKATVLDRSAGMVCDRVRVLTPYPCPPDTLVAEIAKLAAQLPAYDRVSVGFPGLIRGGVVFATPHYVTEAGPFTARCPELVEAWAGYDVQSALATVLDHPTRVINDAEVQGLAVVAGRGYEVVLTLGTGLGFAQFYEGRLLPKVEMSQHPFAKGRSYDERLGNHERRRIGNAGWSRRVVRAIETLQRVLWWDRLYLGGGNPKHLTRQARAELGPGVTIVPNTMGLLGGVRVWDRPAGCDADA